MAQRDGKPVSNAELSGWSGADPALLSRLLKHLAAMGTIEESGVNEYKLTNFSKCLAMPNATGVTNSIYKLPEYLAKTGFRDPDNAVDGPFQFAFDTSDHWFAWAQKNQPVFSQFSNHMGAYHQGRPSWMDEDFYPVESSLVKGARTDADAVMLVDVGGSLGHDIVEFYHKHPKAPGRLVLQDLPAVIEHVKDIERTIEPMSHDFFTEQPIRGARAYYMHSVLHDWPDAACQQILAQITSAMDPGYSKLLINENVIPDIGADWQVTVWSCNLELDTTGRFIPQPMKITGLTMQFKHLAIFAAIGGAFAQRPSNTSICDYYTTALLKENNSTNQYTLLTLLVNTAVIGNYTQPNVGVMVPGILAEGEYMGTPVNLLPYFDGGLASSNRGGSSGVAVNFLDDGGAIPLMMNMPSNTTTSNQYKLLTHLYSYFGVLLGCSAVGTSGYPAYSGQGSQYKVHKFMALDSAQVGYFITQVGLSAASFGVAESDITIVANSLTKVFDYKCAPPAIVVPSQGAQLQSICTADDCMTSPNSTCSSYDSVMEPAVANATLAMGEGSNSTSSSNGNGTSSSSGSGSGSSSTATGSGSSATASSYTGAATANCLQYGIVGTFVGAAALAFAL
ncbi:putative hydroxyindole o [Phaeomoniella chlamydospora]|uniref:Putative hydroxyindole o n=1 Tax=Phaeomoniella chlamydospora TaxID=158046 RepID=A0A0G2GGA2_PHACM|nr:putative hydroxyindole o [Phaeomoniella chlamydospora]